MKKRKYILISIAILLLSLSFFLGDLGGHKTSSKAKEEVFTQEAKPEETAKEELEEKPKEEVQEEKEEPEEALEDKNQEQEPEEVKKAEEKKEEKKDKIEEKKEEKKKEEKKKPEEKKKKTTAKVSLRVECKTILNNMDKLDPGKKDLVPDQGIIYSNQALEISEGETVFKLLQRELRDQGIHLDSSVSPVYKTSYVEGINNIYELDCGELSGWMYKVNGEFPNYGSSSYKLKDGDTIVWIYTCDLGRDIGGGGGSLGGE